MLLFATFAQGSKCSSCSSSHCRVSVFRQLTRNALRNAWSQPSPTAKKCECWWNTNTSVTVVVGFVHMYVYGYPTLKVTSYHILSWWEGRWLNEQRSFKGPPSWDLFLLLKVMKEACFQGLQSYAITSIITLKEEGGYQCQYDSGCGDGAVFANGPYVRVWAPLTWESN